MLEKRDGVARICRTELGETPLMIDFTEKSEISIDFGKAPYPLKEIDPERFEILKSKDERINVATGLAVLSHRKLVETLIELRRDGRLLYTPALATPKNVPILIYLGVDIVDNIVPIIKAYEGIYMLENAEFEIDSLRALPCNCEVCRNSSPKDMDEEKIAKHNTFILKRQIGLVKEHIRMENLRNFVEAHAKFDPALTAMLRIADEHYEFFERYYPVFKKSKLTPTSEDSFERPEIRTFFKRALESYYPKGRTLLILPCSAKKPYSLSKSHRRIRSYLGDLLKGVEEIIVSSPLVVPRVFEMVYPAMNYDVPVTGKWSGDEVEFVAERLKAFVEKGDFDKVIAHVTGGYKRVVEKAGIDAVFTAEDDITSSESLRKLKKALEDAERVDFDLFVSMFEHMFRYQFGVEMPSVDCFVRGRYPNLELKAENRLARIDVRFGMLDIYEEFARYLLEKEVYTVRIDEFEPKGTIFAVGVREAYHGIRPNDLVVFHNDSIFGVGIACMPGWEMEEADGGRAVEVKRCWRL